MPPKGMRAADLFVDSSSDAEEPDDVVERAATASREPAEARGARGARALRAGVAAAVHTCPICMENRPLLLYPCAHPICAACAERAPRACPTCRRPTSPGAAAPRPHAQLDALIRLCHCGHCSVRYDGTGSNMPVLILPCHHHMCRGCLDNLEGCPHCVQTVCGGVDDHAFLRCIDDIPAPPLPVAPPEPTPLQDMCSWLEHNPDVYDIPNVPAAQWDRAHTVKWRTLVSYATEVGTLLPAEHPTRTAQAISEALGFPEHLRHMLFQVIFHTQKIVGRRAALPPCFQNLPMRGHEC